MANADGLGPLLHVTSGENSAGSLRQGLRRLGRKERVVHFWDDLSVGPLHDLNHGAAARLDWWSRVEGKKLPAREIRKLDDRKIWERIVHDARNVVLWYGPHVTEFLYALRACWMLRRVASRLYEVRLPPHPNEKLDAFYGAVGIVGPEGVVRGWPRPSNRTGLTEGAPTNSWNESHFRKARESGASVASVETSPRTARLVGERDLVRTARGRSRSPALHVVGRRATEAACILQAS